MNQHRHSSEKSSKDAPGRQHEAETTGHILQARELYQAGDHPAALDACIAALGSTGRALEVSEAALICEILEGCGQADAAGQLRQSILASTLEAVKAAPDSARANLEAGMFLLETGSEPEAEACLRKALTLQADDSRPAFMLLRILLKRGAADEAISAWEPHVAAVAKPGAALLSLAKGLAHFGFGEHAERILTRAEAHYPRDDPSLAYAAAGIRGQELAADQQTLAVAMFDDFAHFYDQNLAAIGNAGPRLIGAMLEQLPITPQGNLDVLDAGCGTGLCVPYLMPYARLLHGCDFSVGMLQAAHRKGIYHLLTRSDLSVAETLPEGDFDLIICADVLVYFGDLNEVLGNLATRLRPGGWLVFTTEEAGDTDLSAGYRLASSGRYAHSAEHLEEALRANGFSPPAGQITAGLRMEFGLPVMGRVVAAQLEPGQAL